MAGALDSGAAPYLATEIKRRIGEDNPAANAMAHAVLGAVTAQLNGQAPLAGSLGAGGGELAARVIARRLFPGKDPDALSETEKQQVSALSQLAAGIAGGLATGDAAGGVTGAQAGRNAVENNFLDVAELEDFAHRAKVGTGEERKKVIRDMVDTNVRQQDEIREVCTTSPQQCQQRYGYLLDEWELFDDTIKGLAKDKSLPDDFRDYMPAVYMSDVDAGEIVAEHGWTKRFEALGFDTDTARVMAATLPAVVSSVGGGKGNKLGNRGTALKQSVSPNIDSVDNSGGVLVEKQLLAATRIPGVVQSRINLWRGDGKTKGWDHAVREHYSGKKVRVSLRFLRPSFERYCRARKW